MSTKYEIAEEYESIEYDERQNDLASCFQDTQSHK